MTTEELEAAIEAMTLALKRSPTWSSTLPRNAAEIAFEALRLYMDEQGFVFYRP